MLKKWKIVEENEKFFLYQRKFFLYRILKWSIITFLLSLGLSLLSIKLALSIGALSLCGLGLFTLVFFVEGFYDYCGCFNTVDELLSYTVEISNRNKKVTYYLD